MIHRRRVFLVESSEKNAARSYFREEFSRPRPRVAITPGSDIFERGANSNLHAVAPADNGGEEISEDTVRDGTRVSMCIR